MKGGHRTSRAAAAALALFAFAALSSPVLAEQTKFHVRPTLKLKRTVGKDTFRGTLRSKAFCYRAVLVR